jgi:hypothetical protein
MKKIFTLVAGLLMAVVVFAADRRPMVTVNSMKNYKIVIDGRSFFGRNTSINIANLRDGRHTIQVFEMQRAAYGRRTVERMVASTSFRVDRKDVVINIDNRGHLSIREMKRHGNGRFERRDNDRDWDNNRDWNRNEDRDYDYDDRDRRDDNRRF